jgi:hypothetical protein
MKKDVDGRDKPGHDEAQSYFLAAIATPAITSA